MSTPPQQPVRTAGPLRAAAGVLGCGATVTALSLAGAPWWAVAIAIAAAIATPAALGLAQILIPEESAHKRDLWLAVLRHRERRALSRQPQRRGKARHRR
jgi:hypothetical protein